MKLLPYGDRALLLDCESLAEARAWHWALHELGPVLGARTVLLQGNPKALRIAVSKAAPTEPDEKDSAEVVVPVVYDGEDLDEVGQLTGLGADGVIEAHTGTPWTVAFAGFAPGFGYLTGGDPKLVVPRRDSPRPSVPAGSVALAGEFSGIYPRSSPGGWQLIGRTNVILFNIDRVPPALLVPGTRVRFTVSGA
jgi:KipI family sensor histidine kinase inhibitor